jgi:hypothetical protein
VGRPGSRNRSWPRPGFGPKSHLLVAQNRAEDAGVRSELEIEGRPRVVQQHGAAELDVSTCRDVLRVAALHPEDMFWSPCLDGGGEASSAGTDTGEQGRFEADLAQSVHDHV